MDSVGDGKGDEGLLAFRQGSFSKDGTVVGHEFFPQIFVALAHFGKLTTSYGEPLPLTPTEYELLECLALRRGRVLSKEQLRDWLYDSQAEASSNVIEAVVSVLRKKLRPVAAADLIKTQRGFGYFID